MMSKCGYLLIFFLLVLEVNAQELRNDSLLLEVIPNEDSPIHDNESFSLSGGSLYGELTDFTPVLFNFQLFSPTKWEIDYATFKNPFSFAPDPLNYRTGIYVPLLGQYTVTNQAQYHLTDKLSVGGNHFVGNSIYELNNSPFTQPSINGASLFMKYKVSKKIKIETKVTVSNGATYHP